MSPKKIKKGNLNFADLGINSRLKSKIDNIFNNINSILVQNKIKKLPWNLEDKKIILNCSKKLLNELSPFINELNASRNEYYELDNTIEYSQICSLYENSLNYYNDFFIDMYNDFKKDFNNKTIMHIKELKLINNKLSSYDKIDEKLLSIGFYSAEFNKNFNQNSLTFLDLINYKANQNIAKNYFFNILITHFKLIDLIEKNENILNETTFIHMPTIIKELFQKEALNKYLNKNNLKLNANNSVMIRPNDDFGKLFELKRNEAILLTFSTKNNIINIRDDISSYLLNYKAKTNIVNRFKEEIKSTIMLGDMPVLICVPIYFAYKTYYLKTHQEIRSINSYTQQSVNQFKQSF